MRHFVLLASVLVAACGTVPTTQTTTPAQSSIAQAMPSAPASPRAAAPAQPVVPAQQPAAADAAPPVGGLHDLETMTLGCPQAGLNAASREAAQAQAQGRYQFSYFRIVSDSHHALYEVHFTSNDYEDPELKYCVSVYCQQGWDPRNTKISVTPMSAMTTPAQSGAARAAHGPHCEIEMPAPAKPRSKKRQ